AAHAVVAGREAANRASGGIHLAFIPVGILMLIGGLVALLVLKAGAMGAMDLNADTFGALGTAGGILLLMGLIFSGIGFAMRNSARKAAWLRMHGISATAHIQSISPTGMSINDVPMMQFTLLV